MPGVTLIFPHQLFENHPALSRDRRVVLVEDSLFFHDSHYPLRLHKKKLLLHRASMKAYEQELQGKHYSVHYIEWQRGQTIREVMATLAEEGVTDFHYCDPVDFILELRLRRFFESTGLAHHVYESPMFVTPDVWRLNYFKGRKRYLMGSFYQEQRKRMCVLVDKAGQPIGGRWSFDEDNRKRFPKGQLPPLEPWVHQSDARINEAAVYVNQHFPEGVGSTEDFAYAVTRKQAQQWLQRFLEERLSGFGDYEDAITRQHTVLYHSVLTPMLNIGLLTPQEVVTAALDYANENAVPLNSLEGFVRQIIGWREFMRAVYVEVGVKIRNSNFWGFTRPLPRAFYEGATGITPVDEVIRRVLKHGYCHHIERLMVLGNFMLLCGFRPDDVYTWFMELFIDAYDWVMVPNIYGMSQFADGGTFTTKPYISGSNYVLKMSDHQKGDWCGVWDALFWTFISDHEKFFLSNPRLSMMGRQAMKMASDEMTRKRAVVQRFLESLD